ncbi:TPA: phosphate ABC transporter permease subunit PstC [Candidatus Poribacteria bacterium]|nr:phosphate ABC transporter permease subunit PstC [Candidatus Poribacteria bacterium]
MITDKTEKKVDKTHISESIFRKILYLSGVSMLFLLFAIFLTLLIRSLPAIRSFGLSFLYGSKWDPVLSEFGSLPFIIGTLITSFIALIISIPFSFSISIFLGEYFKEGILSSVLKSVTELLAGIPSVIYGFCSIFILVPAVRALEMKIGVTPLGVGIFTASIVLSIMIIPYSASLGREVIQLVPSELKEAAYSLGATRYEVIKEVILPYARSGIFAGVLLSLGRALGETMAVTMVIGNKNAIPKDIFSPSNTMASVIANEFMEASPGSIHLSSLVGVGLLLFVITTIVNIIGRYIIKRLSVEV